MAEKLNTISTIITVTHTFTGSLLKDQDVEVTNPLLNVSPATPHSHDKSDKEAIRRISKSICLTDLLLF